MTIEPSGSFRNVKGEEKRRRKNVATEERERGREKEGQLLTFFSSPRIVVVPVKRETRGDDTPTHPPLSLRGDPNGWKEIKGKGRRGGEAPDGEMDAGKIGTSQQAIEDGRQRRWEGGERKGFLSSLFLCVVSLLSSF